MRGPSLGREHTQDTRSTANIEDSLALEKMRIAYDRAAVRTRADAVFEHLFMDTW